MKFVFFGYDFMLGAVRRLLEDGHEAAGFFTFNCDNVFNFNRELIALAAKLSVPVILSPPEDIHIDSFLARGADVFIVGGYPYKIPPIPEDRAYALNVHPSLLPRGRGLMPTPHILMHAPEAAGVTVHKLTEKFDAGDVLYQSKIALSPRETVETYSARIALKVPEILSYLLSDLPAHWDKARAQDEDAACTFPVPTDETRSVKWNMLVAEIDSIARAFGRFGVLAALEGVVHIVYDLDVWAEPHKLKPGTIAARLPREIVVAARDGFVVLKEISEPV